MLVDRDLNSPSMAGDPSLFTVIANSAQAAAGGHFTGPHPLGERLPVKIRDRSVFVEIRDLPPSEVVVLTNRQ